VCACRACAMLPVPPRRSSTILPYLWVFILIAAGFLAGRLSVGVVPASTAYSDPSAHDPRVPALQSSQKLTKSSGFDADGSWHPVAQDWSELALQSGLLASRPLLPIGYNGRSEYVIQPFQVLLDHLQKGV
jgi:hypothetical protein